jgi:murein L,D-transpeptidase YafK
VYRIEFASKLLGTRARRMIRACPLALLALLSGPFVLPAAAFVIELDDVAPDRIERQRAFARGVPQPSSAPEASELRAELAAKGPVEGAPILIRIFKAESELELWMRKGNAYALKATYPICHWTGTLGPKLREGDKQSPEGFYTIGPRQMRHRGRWREAFNLGFPNLHDKRLDRTGSYILVHGGCSSTGCYAMTEPVQRVIYRLAAAALRGRQAHFQVHVFPFRMTDANMAAHADSPWADFWRDLKAGYDAFETTRLPPRIGVCGQRYTVARAAPGVRNDSPMTRVEPGSPSAAGFDTSRCSIPVVRPAEQIAEVPEEAGNPDTRTVARVERQEVADAPPSPALRQRQRRAAQRQKRPRTREARRAHREALSATYRRTMVGISQ